MVDQPRNDDSHDEDNADDDEPVPEHYGPLFRRAGPRSLRLLTDPTNIVMAAKRPDVRRSKRLASREAFVDAVPVADLVLAQLPAQEHDFVTPERREVEEAFLQ
jgi:hypothetical protein